MGVVYTSVGIVYSVGPDNTPLIVNLPGNTTSTTTTTPAAIITTPAFTTPALTASPGFTASAASASVTANGGAISGAGQTKVVGAGLLATVFAIVAVLL